MLDRRGIIFVEKHKAGISIVSAAIWITISILLWWIFVQSLGQLSVGIEVQGKLFQLSILVLLFLAFFSIRFILNISYKIDLINDVITIRNHYPFWTKSKSERIIVKEIIEIKQDKTYTNSLNLIVKINKRKIVLFNNLHRSDIGNEIRFLTDHAFRDITANKP
ncbi:hypothetical protein A8938_2336 [Algoriphagus zhangzhouensis]|uniref:Uncharacterized protein n=1 Tax=Algoriphagus zhangzhouensis TaxID=1073327 RepID=A0A1M7ZD32_9BACT|nr:hypothetical protein A8938_2336 [Algoriphagus zhangzhouensis]SHO62815.1 hypothetical protein SAMN04488108_2333 [Algoriphagus zhangzhouensis]